MIKVKVLIVVMIALVNHTIGQESSNSTYTNTVKSSEKKTKSLINGIDKLSLTGWNKTHEAVRSQNIGWHYFAYFNAKLNEDKFTMSVKFKDDGEGDFEMGIGKRASFAGTAITLVKSKKRSFIKFYRLFDPSNPTEIIEARQVLTKTLDNKKEYLLSITKDVNNLIVRLIYNDGDIFECTTNTSAIGRQWGYPTIWSITGQCMVSEFDFLMPYAENRDPKLLIFGDSFIEGNSIRENKKERYSALLARELGEENVVLLGRGGESSSSLLNRFYQQVDWFEDAKYCLLAIGTNDSNFEIYKGNMKIMIAYLKSKNIIPILVTVTYRGDKRVNSAFIAQSNSWVRNLGEKYIDMSLAVTVIGDETLWRTGFQKTDKVHPSITGHLFMYRRVEYDAPFLFK